MGAVTETSTRDVQAALDRLHSRRDAWVGVGARERIALLERCIDGLARAAEDWVDRACDAQSVDPESAAAGELWLSGPFAAIRGFRLMADALEAGGAPTHGPVRAVGAGRVAVGAFPRTAYERVLYPGVSAEVWIRPGEPPTQGRLYREKAAGSVPPGRVAGILGAGNVGSIPALDVLHKLFAEDQVVLLKPNPVNGYLGPILESALRPLVEAGFLALVSGGREVGEALAFHELVDTVHLTGSRRTHDALVWGADPDEGARRRASGTPRLTKPVTSELGCVTPVLVVPGPWSDSDLRFHARSIAGMVTNNGSFNCVAAKVVVTAGGWDLRGPLLDALRAALQEAPPRRAYYPGAEERWRAFLERYPRAELLGRSGEGIVPWTLLPGVAARRDEYALSEEAFCGVLADVPLDAADPGSFLSRAVPFANDDVAGTLSCMILVHPATARALGATLDEAIAALRYGGIAVNSWTGMSFVLGQPTWGAWPGREGDDVVSGTGVVHNALLFDHPEKTLLKAPFRPWPKPPWAPDHASLLELGRRLARFETEPSWRLIPGLVAAAARG